MGALEDSASALASAAAFVDEQAGMVRQGADLGNVSTTVATVGDIASEQWGPKITALSTSIMEKAAELDQLAQELRDAASRVGSGGPLTP